MERLHSIDDFNALQDRIAANLDPEDITFIINAGTCGQASGANGLIRVAKRELLEQGRPVNLRITGCHGFCEMEPSILIKPGNVFYPNVDRKDIPRIMQAAAEDQVVEELLYQDPSTGERIAKQEDLPFFRSQKRTLLSRNEDVDPIRIYTYLGSGGYNALASVLANGSRAWIINEVKVAGLRGRGGAGFPTGTKWEMLANAPGGRGKSLVCNADEGDPGAYMDRSILEGNPHSIIEGMLIAAFATGTTEGVVYVRDEYPLAIKHLVIALRQARGFGLLGDKILGHDFSFDISVVRGAGAFVCGEETALMRSIEGRMGEPRQRPPFPVQRGIEGKPTAINNVETWANIPIILQKGALTYARTGTKNASGTKIFSLVGKIKNTGLVEVPMGIPLHEIINDIGGGPADGASRIKAVQTGGPSGGCIPAKHFDLPVDYEGLAKAGSIVGSGGMIVMDESTCMVDVAKYFMCFLKDESCGKCFTCRKGTQRMYEILEDISVGRGKMEDLELLEELAHVVKDTSMCGLGQSAPNPVLSNLRYFRKEFERHIHDKRCDAFVCKDLVGAPCHAACPIGTEAWRYVAHIARGEYEDAYKVIREENPFPSVCARVCDHKCEAHCRLGASGNRPVAIRALKRFVTDRFDPKDYPAARKPQNGNGKYPVAVVGTGPAGLTAAHYLSREGYKVTVIEAECKPGGMLLSGVPSYRLPREVLEREIDAVLDDNITLRCNTVFGKDVTVDSLFEEGHKALFLALGAHRSRKLDVEGEGAGGVYPSMKFLKAWNLRGQNLAEGRVGVIGGGNSAIDAARVAVRQPGVDNVTIFYRRTEHEMPAFASEVEAAREEGVKIATLVSPTKIVCRDGKISGIELRNNTLGQMDPSGRRRPVPAEGSEHVVGVDTLVVAIGEQIQPFEMDGSMNIEVSKWGTIESDDETLQVTRKGVFAGGDVVTGPNTVVDAIAAGKRAAMMIDRYVHDHEMRQPAEIRVPRTYVQPEVMSEQELESIRRAEPPKAALDERQHGFTEVELSLTEKEAKTEARRCLRCDLEFTSASAQPPADQVAEIGGAS